MEFRPAVMVAMGIKGLQTGRDFVSPFPAGWAVALVVLHIFVVVLELYGCWGIMVAGKTKAMGGRIMDGSKCLQRGWSTR